MFVKLLGLRRVGIGLVVIGLAYVALTLGGKDPQPAFAGGGLAALGLALAFVAVRPRYRWRQAGFLMPLVAWIGLWTAGGVANIWRFVEGNGGLVFPLVFLAVAWVGLRTVVLGWGKRRTGQFSSSDQPGR